MTFGRLATAAAVLAVLALLLAPVRFSEASGAEPRCETLVGTRAPLGEGAQVLALGAVLVAASAVSLRIRRRQP